MTQNLVVRKTLSFLLLIGQLFSLPLMSAQRLNANERKIQREKDLLVMQKIAGEYNKSATLFNQKGSQAFVDSLPNNIFINEQKNFFIKELKGIYSLPLLEVNNSHLIVKDADSTYKMPIDQVLDGIFVFDDGALLYNFNRDVIYNIESWKDQTKKAGKSAYLNWLQFLFIPQAEAKFKLGMGTVIGAILGGLLGAWIGNYFDKKKRDAAEAAEVAATAAHGTTQRAGTIAGNITPPPSVSETLGPATKTKDDKNESSNSSQSESDPKKDDTETSKSKNKFSRDELLKRFNTNNADLAKWEKADSVDTAKGYDAVANAVLDELLQKINNRSYTAENVNTMMKIFIFPYYDNRWVTSAALQAKIDKVIKDYKTKHNIELKK